MQTSNNDSVFTSTTDIHTLYTFGKVLGIGSFGKVILAKLKSNPSKSYAIKMIDKKNLGGKETILANEIYTL
jgi:calcium-dependent protein kinase